MKFLTRSHKRRQLWEEHDAFPKKAVLYARSQQNSDRLHRRNYDLMVYRWVPEANLLEEIPVESWDNWIAALDKEKTNGVS